MTNRDLCLFDDMPCTCDQGRPCMMTDHDIDLPGPMPLALVFTQRVQMILAVVCLAFLALAGTLLVQHAREIDRQLATEARV